VRPYAIPTGRRFKRTPINMPVKVIVGSQGGEFEEHSQAVDASEGGLRVRLNTPLQPGQTVFVVPEENPSCVLRTRVAWSRKPEAGLEYVDPFPRL
jgi:hypothetical protein